MRGDAHTCLILVGVGVWVAIICGACSWFHMRLGEQVMSTSGEIYRSTLTPPHNVNVMFILGTSHSQRARITIGYLLVPHRGGPQRENAFTF